MKTEKVLNTFISSVEAAKSLNGSPTHIRQVSGKKPRNAYGYYWEYVN